MYNKLHHRRLYSYLKKRSNGQKNTKLNLHPCLKKREIVRKYTEACVGDLASKLESAEIENNTLILFFTDQEALEAFKEHKEHYFSCFRQFYSDAKEMVKQSCPLNSFTFTNIETKVKPRKQHQQQAKKLQPIHIDLIRHSEFVRNCFSKMIEQVNQTNQTIQNNTRSNK